MTASASNDWLRSTTSRNVPNVTSSRDPSVLKSEIVASRSACGYGNDSNRIGFTALKIAVLAPMPSASVSTATLEKPALRRRVRTA
jgi:hypothetical protein